MYHSIIYNMSHSKDTCSVQLYRYISTGDNHPAKGWSQSQQWANSTDVQIPTIVPDIV